MKTFMLSIASLALLPSAAGWAQSVAPQDQIAIDDAVNGGIRDWHAEDDRGIYLRDRANRWYYAAFRHVCPGVLSNPRIQFDTNGDRRFDRLSRVITETESCGVDSVTLSAAPADKGGPK